MATAETTVRSDEEIQRDMLKELKRDARVQPNEIGVAVKDGVVILTGWVDSYIKKWAAEDYDTQLGVCVRHRRCTLDRFGGRD